MRRMSAGGKSNFKIDSAASRDHPPWSGRMTRLRMAASVVSAATGIKLSPHQHGRKRGLRQLNWLNWMMRCSNSRNVVAFTHMARCVSLYLFVLLVIGTLSGGFLSLAKAAGPDSPGELTRLELLAQTANTTGTNQVLRLRGADARQQLLVTANFSTGALRDYTRD